MNGNSKNRLLADLQDEEARKAYVEGHVRAGIAYQIRAMRDSKGWSQKELGQRMGNAPQAAQAAIARLENPDYGRFSVSTLLDMASAFDVALMVRFVSYSDLLRLVTDAAPDTLAPVDYMHDFSVQSERGQASILKSAHNDIKASNVVQYTIDDKPHTDQTVGQLVDLGGSLDGIPLILTSDFMSIERSVP